MALSVIYILTASNPDCKEFSKSIEANVICRSSRPDQPLRCDQLQLLVIKLHPSYLCVYLSRAQTDACIVGVEVGKEIVCLFGTNDAEALAAAR
jgi:hypothetical protein